MHEFTTSAPLLVQARLLQMIARLSAVDPKVIEAEIEQYLQDNGIVSAGYTYDRHYVAASTWIIDHNLNKFPQVTLIDDEGNIIDADVAYGSLNQVTITFAEPQSGKAVLI